MLWERNIALLKCGKINARADWLLADWQQEPEKKHSSKTEEGKIFFADTKQDQLTWGKLFKEMKNYK